MAFMMIVAVLLMITAVTTTARTIVIGVSGATRSGKSTLAKNLCETLGKKHHCARISQDSFFFDYPFIRDELNGNYDDPEAINHDEFYAKAMKKKKALDEMSGKDDVKYLVLEGFLLYHEKRFVDMMDEKIWLDAPKNVIEERRMRTKPCTKAEFDLYIWPCYEKYKKKVFANCNLMEHMIEIDGTLEEEEILKIALQKMKKQKSQSMEPKPEEKKVVKNQDQKSVTLPKSSGSRTEISLMMAITFVFFHFFVY